MSRSRIRRGERSTTSAVSSVEPSPRRGFPGSDTCSQERTQGRRDDLAFVEGGHDQVTRLEAPDLEQRLRFHVLQGQRAEEQDPQDDSTVQKKKSTRAPSAPLVQIRRVGVALRQDLFARRQRGGELHPFTPSNLSSETMS